MLKTKHEQRILCQARLKGRTSDVKSSPYRISLLYPMTVKTLSTAVSRFPKSKLNICPQNFLFDNGNNGRPPSKSNNAKRGVKFRIDAVRSKHYSVWWECFLVVSSAPKKLNVTLSFLCCRNNREESWGKVITYSYIVCYFNTLF